MPIRALRALYQAAATAKGIPAFALTVSDYFNAPTIAELNLTGYTGKSGKTITLRAVDDFAVTAVSLVRLPDATGLEQGPATYDRGGWKYVTTASVPAGQFPTVEVTAVDRPGNRTTETRALAT